MRSPRQAGQGQLAAQIIRLPISILLLLYQQHKNYSTLGAHEFRKKFNLSLASVKDPTFLTAGDQFFGYPFADWIDVGNQVPAKDFTARDFGEYLNFLRDDNNKTVSIFYLVPNSFRSPLSALVVNRPYLRTSSLCFPLQRARGATRFTLCTSQF